MNEPRVDDDLARRFLLGQLSAQEQGQVEEMAFADPDTFALLESAEDDLIDEFLQGELLSDEQERFNKHFLLQPGRAENLKLSRVVQHYLSKADVALDQANVAPVVAGGRVSILGWFTISRPAFRFSLVVAALLAIVIALALFIRIRQLQTPPAFEVRNEPSVTPTPEIRNTPPIEPAPRPTPAGNKNSSPSPPRKPRGPAYAMLLPSASVRGEAQQLTVRPKATVKPVELPLMNKTAYRSYEVTLKSDNGEVLKSWSNQRARRLRAGRGLLLYVPTALLNPDDLYLITVSGRSAAGKLTEVDRYPFQVVNQ